MKINEVKFVWKTSDEYQYDGSFNDENYSADFRIEKVFWIWNTGEKFGKLNQSQKIKVKRTFPDWKLQEISMRMDI